MFGFESAAECYHRVTCKFPSMKHGADPTATKKKRREYFTKSLPHVSNIYELKRDSGGNAEAHGKGTYGTVVLGRHRVDKTNRVAVKVFKKDASDDWEYLAKREIDAVTKLKDHQNIIQIIGVYQFAACDVCMVMEFADYNLYELLSPEYNSKMWSDRQIKCIIKQLCTGVQYCHQNGIMHRDLKPENVLVTAPSGHVKLADFGMSHEHLPTAKYMRYTNHVTTQYYRAPELFLGAEFYDEAVDVWSLGCIIAEIVLGGVLFKGDVDNNPHQMELIWALCGTPITDEWPVELHKNVAQSYARSKVRRTFSKETLGATRSCASVELVDLLDRMLQIVPGKRISARGGASGPPAGVLDHPYFLTEKPLPMDPGMMIFRRVIPPAAQQPAVSQSKK